MHPASTQGVPLSTLRTKRLRDGRTDGECPYGHGVDAAGQLVPHPGEQAVIACVRAWRAEGVSLRGIVARLAAAGVVSRVGRPLALTQVARIVRGPGHPELHDVPAVLTDAP